MNRPLEKISLKIQEAIPWLIAALAVLSANWAASAFYETFQVWGDGQVGMLSPLRLGSILFFGAMVVLFYSKRNVFFRPHTRHLTNEPSEPRKHLVLFLSSLPLTLEPLGGIPQGIELSFNTVIEDLKILEKGKEKGIRWSWEMPLRAMRHHLGFLETVILICSKESFSQVPLFLRICKRYPEFGLVTFFVVGQNVYRTELICFSSSTLDCSQHRGLDFESFDELSRTLWALLKEFKKRRFLEQDIMIDFTGGQKVTSVVAATMTYNRKIKAQYVQTNPPWAVLSYDVALGSSGTGKLDI